MPASPVAAPAARADTGAYRKESLIAADITIEGKIEGGGSVRIAGKFKGDVNVQGDLTIEAGRQADRQRARRQGHDCRRTRGQCRAGVPRRFAADRRGGRRPEGRFADGRGRCAHARSGRVRLGRRQGPESTGKLTKIHDAEIGTGVMSSVRPGTPGRPAHVPHCRETILESAAVCPAAGITCASLPAPMRAQAPVLTPLRIEGSIRHPADGEPGNTRWSCRSATIAAKKSPTSSSAWVR